MQTALASIGRILLFVFAFGVALYATQYWTFEVVGFLHLQPPEVLANNLYRSFFYGHVIAGPIALISGPFQFLPKFRARYLNVHRAIGKVYIVACLIGGLAALGAAQFTPAGPFTKLGFSLLGIGWLYTTISETN